MARGARLAIPCGPALCPAGCVVRSPMVCPDPELSSVISASVCDAVRGINPRRFLSGPGRSQPGGRRPGWRQRSGRTHGSVGFDRASTGTRFGWSWCIGAVQSESRSIPRRRRIARVLAVRRLSGGVDLLRIRRGPDGVRAPGRVGCTNVERGRYRSQAVP